MAHSPSGAVRAGYLIATVLLALTAAFGVLSFVSIGVGLARHGDSLLYGDTLRVPVQVSAEDVRVLPAGLRLASWLDTTLEVRHPTSRQMFLRSAVDIGPLLLFLVGLWQVRGLMRAVLHGDPFGRSNVRRLRRLGFLFVLGAPIVEIMNYSLRSVLFNALPPYPQIHLGIAGFNLPAAALLAGLGAFIVAEVFAHGSRLREDVEGTI